MDAVQQPVSTGTVYSDNFEPKAYLDYRFNAVNDRHAQILRHLHEFYLTIPAGVTVLDIGSGPIISYVISAATRASKIVLAEYTEKNREELQFWIDGSPSGHDWGPYFKYVVQNLEGKGPEAALERARQLRQLIKAVIPCDVNKDPPVEGRFTGLYDIVTSSLCLEAACSSAEEYIAAVGRLWKLLKKGGKLVLQCADGSSATHFYMVGTQKFTVLSATPELIRSALDKAGFYDVSITKLPNITCKNEEASHTATRMYFVTAMK